MDAKEVILKHISLANKTRTDNPKIGISVRWSKYKKSTNVIT